jgi:peptidoglycan L-alanyl-D-glutamate endopeptidase CwlK
VTDKLNGIHPHLVVCVAKILDVMQILGHPMIVTDGVRTMTQQAALFAQGRTAPGPIVTNADGVVKHSNHQVHDSDGFGHAVDLAFLVDGKPSWDDKLPWATYGYVAKTLGLRWGGDDPGFIAAHMVDRPHIEIG